MLSKIKKFVVVASLIASLAAPVALPASTVYADTVQGGLCEGSGSGSTPSIPQDLSSTSTDNCKKPNDQATTSVNNLIRDFLIILSVVVGIIAVVMIIIGGFHYVTSGGSQEKVKKAKDTLLYAIIGIIIVALAQIIVNFVLHKTITSTG